MIAEAHQIFIHTMNRRHLLNINRYDNQARDILIVLKWASEELSNDNILPEGMQLELPKNQTNLKLKPLKFLPLLVGVLENFQDIESQMGAI